MGNAETGGSSSRETCRDKAGAGRGRAVDHAIEHSYVREAVVPERKLPQKR